MLYQISWRAARKADKHGEYGGQQLNSVLTVQLMGFFCCSNEIFCRDVGKYVLKQGDVVHMHPFTDTHRQYKGHRKRQYAKERLAHTFPFFCLTLGATPKFYYSRAQLPKSDIKCIQARSTEGPKHTTTVSSLLTTVSSLLLIPATELINNPIN